MSNILNSWFAECLFLSLQGYGFFFSFCGCIHTFIFSTFGATSFEGIVWTPLEEFFSQVPLSAAEVQHMLHDVPMCNTLSDARV